MVTWSRDGPFPARPSAAEARDCIQPRPTAQPTDRPTDDTHRSTGSTDRSRSSLPLSPYSFRLQIHLALPLPCHPRHPPSVYAVLGIPPRGGVSNFCPNRCPSTGAVSKFPKDSGPGSSDHGLIRRWQIDQPPFYFEFPAISNFNSRNDWPVRLIFERQLGRVTGNWTRRASIGPREIGFSSRTAALEPPRRRDSYTSHGKLAIDAGLNDTLSDV